MMKQIVWMSLLLAAWAGCNGATTPAKSPAADVRLQIRDYAGIEELIKDQRGKVVVMDAWSTSCPPCLREFPNLVALHKKYGRDDVACISLSFDYEGTGRPEDVRDRVLGVLRRFEATFDNVLSSEEADALYKKFELSAIPAVFVYDRSGKLRKRFDNESGGPEFTYQDVEALLVELLAEKKEGATGGGSDGESKGTRDGEKRSAG